MINLVKLSKLVILSLISTLFILTISGCQKNHRDHSLNQVNPELEGVWSDDSGCRVELSKKSSSLLLMNFQDRKGTRLESVELAYVKDGVMTNLIPINKRINLKVNYLEGVMTIDRYCQHPLSKIGN